MYLIITFFIIIVICIVLTYRKNLSFKESNRKMNIKLSSELLIDLKILHDKLINEGCIDFYIDGVSEHFIAEGYCLELRNDKWIVYFIERGEENSPMFSNEDTKKAFNFFYDFLVSKEHWHIVAFTRSSDIFNFHKNKLEECGVITIQNDFENYKTQNDHVYRLFVKNKDIFKAKKYLIKSLFLMRI